MKKGMCDERVEEEEEEGMEESARQQHPKYLESSNVWNYFFHTPHFSASRRRTLHLQALFQALAFAPPLIGQNDSGCYQPLDDGFVCDGGVPCPKTPNSPRMVQRASFSGLGQG
ncbi:uncharacterized protein N7473_011252 [Penicillium subrubescens]|uniref:uncharacterized protein n=1 Tax=Penicillium subrubescens TaxID=1316194 RepID=UPI002544FCA4|nr:uncharacterized protein N7473_011252 [Penicillium subrubescens]KAJ5880199.1 hypothetical protein N7473_011252 [Penicillium subrubescens]